MQMQRSTIYSSVEFHHTKQEDGSYFGVVSLRMPSVVAENTSNIDIHSMNDMSGSMMEDAADGRTKMLHLKLTLCNIVSLIAGNPRCMMEIAGFDDSIVPVLERTAIEPEQIQRIHGVINMKLAPRGYTNIELALIHSHGRLGNHTGFNGDKHMIFMTDGNITKGSSNISELRKLVREDSQNYFVGFGESHDFELLQSLSDRINCHYYYVDAIENAGLVFGEIVHNILHPALRSGKIVVENCEIYDFNDGKWKTELELPILCEEVEKHYHIRSETPASVEIHLTGVLGPDQAIDIRDNPCHELSDVETSLEHEYVGIEDLTKYIFRQKTQEAMFEAAEYAKIAKKEKGEFTRIQNRLNALREEIEEYSNQNVVNLLDTAFLKQLQDDLYICGKKLKSDRGLLYINTRRSTQGREGSYNITNITREYGENEEIEDGEDYQIERTAYNIAHTTPRQLTTMRTCSQTPYAYEDEDLVDDYLVKNGVMTQTTLELEDDVELKDDVELEGRINTPSCF